MLRRVLDGDKTVLPNTLPRRILQILRFPFKAAPTRFL